MWNPVTEVESHGVTGVKVYLTRVLGRVPTDTFRLLNDVRVTNQVTECVSFQNY